MAIKYYLVDAGGGRMRVASDVGTSSYSLNRAAELGISTGGLETVSSKQLEKIQANYYEQNRPSNPTPASKQPGANVGPALVAETKMVNGVRTNLDGSQAQQSNIDPNLVPQAGSLGGASSTIPGFGAPTTPAATTPTAQPAVNPATAGMTPEEAAGGPAGLAAYQARIAGLAGGVAPAPTALTTPTPTTPAAPVSNYTGPSIVDFLNSIGQPSNFAARAQLAAQNGIQGYTGTAAQNTQLLNQLRGPSQSTLGTPMATNTPAVPVGSGDPLDPNSQIKSYFDQVKDELGIGDITPPNKSQSPITAFADTYKQLYDEMGLNTIKQQFDSVQKEYDDLQVKKQEEVAAINNDPWLSEGVRVSRVRKVAEKYDIKESNLTSKMSLYQSFYDSGREDAKFVAQQAISMSHDQQQFDQQLLLKAIDMAENRSLAALSGQEFDSSVYREVQGGLYDTQNNKWVIPPEPSTSGSGSSGSGSGSGGGSTSNYNQVLYDVGLPVTTATSKGLITQSSLNKVVGAGVPLDIANGIWSNIIAGNSLEEIRQGLLKQIGDRDTAYGYLDKFMQALQGGSTGSTSSATSGLDYNSF